MQLGGSVVGPGQPNEICVFPVRRPLGVVAGLATLTVGPMHTTAEIPIVMSLNKGWPPSSLGRRDPAVALK